jgi:DNA-binding transcriptional regulator YhcF (GntR family)
MAYKDPEQQRLKSRECMKRLRAKRFRTNLQQTLRNLHKQGVSETEIRRIVGVVWNDIKDV